MWIRFMDESLLRVTHFSRPWSPSERQTTGLLKLISSSIHRRIFFTGKRATQGRQLSFGRVPAAPCRYECLVPGLSRMKSCTVGPQETFAAFVFAGSVHSLLPDGGIFIKLKDQDYALSKRVYLKASTDPGFQGADTLNAVLNVAYLAAECKDEPLDNACRRRAGNGKIT